MGCIAPTSHRRTVEALTFSTAANATWLRLFRVRRVLIFAAEYIGIGERQSRSYYFIRRKQMRLASCNSTAVS